jgi:hypothetical protein
MDIRDSPYPTPHIFGLSEAQGFDYSKNIMLAFPRKDLSIGVMGSGPVFFVSVNCTLPFQSGLGRASLLFGALRFFSRLPRFHLFELRHTSDQFLPFGFYLVPLLFDF